MTDKQPSYVLVLDGWIPVQVLDENDSCNPYMTSYCGGCGYCMIAQANYYGFRCRPLKGFWHAYYEVHHILNRITFPLRVHLLGIWHRGPLGYYRHRQNLRKFLDKF